MKSSVNVWLSLSLTVLHVQVENVVNFCSHLFLLCSMTASRTATSRATPFSLGLKVTARGRRRLSAALSHSTLHILSSVMQEILCNPSCSLFSYLFPLPLWHPLPPLWFLQESTLVVWAATSMTRSPVQWPSLEPLSPQLHPTSLHKPTATMLVVVCSRTHLHTQTHTCSASSPVFFVLPG